MQISFAHLKNGRSHQRADAKKVLKTQGAYNLCDVRETRI